VSIAMLAGPYMHSTYNRKFMVAKI
jgi:hypothetical protein